MDQAFILCLLAAAGSAAICWLVLRHLLRLRHGIFSLDVPNERSLHSDPTPKGGGIILIGAAILVWMLLNLFWIMVDNFSVLLIIGVAVIGCLGWLDDHRGLRIRTKLVVEIAVGAIAILVISVPGEIRFAGFVFQDLPTSMMVPVTLLWVVWMTNLFNFMDGVDGLVASQTILLSVVVGGWFYLEADFVVMVFCFSLAGAGIGFLCLNWPPSRIFLGDAGSLMLGMVFALLAFRGVQQHDIPISAFLLLYGVFLFDTTFTLCRRFFSGQRWWEAHRTHGYQRAVRCGLGHAQVTVLAMVWGVCLAILGTLEVLGISREFLWLPAGLALLLAAMLGIRLLERNVALH